MPKWRGDGCAVTPRYGLCSCRWRDRFIIGDKVSVKEEIARYRETLGVDHFQMRCHWPGMEFEKSIASIRRLGELFA